MRIAVVAILAFLQLLSGWRATLADFRGSQTYHSRGYVRDETGGRDHRPSLYLEARALGL